MAEKQFAEKETIFQEGDIADVAYIIRTGGVEILKHGDSGEVKLAEVGEGEIFGEMGLFDPQSPRSASARAMEDTTVDIVSAEELHEMVNQCPPRLLPIINTVFERLRATNQRVKQKEQATALLEIDVDKIVVSPLSEELKESFEPVEMPVAHLPLRIGGYPFGEENPNEAHVSIENDGPPLTVSVQHCEVAIDDGKLILRDLGSRYNTTVNDETIGRGKGMYSIPLQKGENTVILGNKKTSTYHVKVECL